MAISSTVASDDEALRQLFARRLRKEGWDRLCKGVGEEFSYGAEQFSKALFMSMSLGLISFLALRYGWSIWLVALGYFGAVAIAAWLTQKIGVGSLGVYLVLLAGWVTLAGARLWNSGIDGVVFTHLVPVALVVGAISGWDAVRLAVSIPMFVPVAFLLVLLPLLTQDPWTVADAAGARLFLFAGLTIVPLLGFVAFRQWRVYLLSAFTDAADSLSNEPSVGERALALLGRWKRREAGIDTQRARERIGRAIQASSPQENARSTCTSIEKKFRRQIARQLISLSIGIAVSTGILIYFLAWVVVPASVAISWTGSSVPMREVYGSLAPSLPFHWVLMLRLLFC